MQKWILKGMLRSRCLAQRSNATWNACIPYQDAWSYINFLANSLLIRNLVGSW